MKTKLTEFNLGGGSVYQTPVVNSLEIVNEGLLCGSLSQYHLGGGGQYSDDYINDNGEY